MKKTFKVILGIILAIILGAVGSGVWERVLAPSIDASFRFFIDSISHISTVFKDSIYYSAANGMHENFSFRLFLLVECLLILIIALLTLRIPPLSETNVVILLKLFFLKKIGRYTIIVLAWAFLIFSMFALAKNHYTQDIREYVVNSSVILRPYIGEQEFNQLLSDFYQVKSVETFNKFNEHLIDKAKSHHVELPNYEPL